MLGSRPQRKPTFLWQGVLILLPVTIMSATALLAIRRDKAAVEQEARQHAAELASLLAAGLAKHVPARLVAYDLFSFAWFKHQWDLTTKNLPLRDDYESRLAGWQAANPGLSPEAALPNRLSFTPGGVLLWPPNYAQPPQAAPWFLALTPVQRQAWDALANAELAASDPTNSDLTLRAFLESNPSPEARASADFIWLRTRLSRQVGQNAMQALLRASQDYTAVRNESGLPLLSLAAAEALRLARKSGEAQFTFSMDSTGASDTGHELLNWILNEPSVITPLLLDRLQELTDTDAVEREKFQPAIRAARSIWTSQERVHELAEALRRHWPLGRAATNFWLASASGPCFCHVQPDQLTLSLRNAQDALVPQTNDVINVSVYPKSAIEHAFAGAIQELDFSIPAYFELNIGLENERLSPPEADSFNGESRKGATHSSSSTVLAETRASFEAVPVSSIAGSAAVQGSQKMSEASASVLEPQFAVQVRLGDSRLLFATQRERTWLFAGLIVASGVAALVGFIAAYRSFRRQLRLSEMKSNFVSSVSHELRAPIASVRLMAESLERGKIADSQKQHEYFRFIVQECRRLSSLIENVLDFSRIEQGRKQFEFEPTDIVALTGQTVKLMEAYATERQVALVQVVQDARALGAESQLLADGKAIQQALINLIDNAVKHSSKGQTVAVGLGVRSGECGVRNEDSKSTSQAQEQRWIVLWVEDHGEGIPAEEHEKIFERFYRLGSELRRQTQGVGIGLSIVKHVVEAHGGRVEVRSEPGQGSRFTIELPLTTLAPLPRKSETRNPKAE